jgi:TatD DNase family protein
LIDSHCHLGHVHGDPAEVVAEARALGVEAVVDIGMGIAESEAVAARAAGIDGVFAAVGIHPNELEEFERDPGATMAALRDLVSKPGVVGVGETGLDTYRDRWPLDLQETAFRAHIALAREADKALVIHCRDAHERVLEILDEAGAPDRVVMHCFSADSAYASVCAERGFYCSFAGNVTYKKSHELRQAVRAVPDDLLLVETDAPYLAPLPFRGKPNRPALVIHTAQTLAGVRDVPFEDIDVALSRNAKRAFGFN